MPPKFAHGLRARCVAVAFLLATAQAADPAPSAMGLTRDEVLNRYGDPKSQIAAGNRVVMIYAKERLVLRDGVVVEVERLPTEPVRKAPPPPPPAPVAAATDGTTTPASGADRPATSTPAAATTSQPAMPPATPAAQPTAEVRESAAPAEPAPAEPQVQIKLVRPPSGKYTRPPVKSSTTPATTPSVPAASPTTAPSAPSRSTTPPVPPPVATVPSPEPPMTAKPTAVADTAVAAPLTKDATEVRSPMAGAAESPAVTAPTPEVSPGEDKAKADESSEAEAKAKAVKTTKPRRAARDDSLPDPDLSDAFLTTRTFVIGFIVIAGGVAYLVWRARQRQLVLAATAVSHSPFSPTPGAVGGGVGGAVFTPALLAKLEWKRFEELVAAYYSKTGVVAVRTKTGPNSPVHIKISWKGEPRPFACVQCIAHPTGLIDAQPLQELMAVLDKEDIRRGYVITAGKFSVPARDFAEEKHLTLLPGDIFLEKLNALPDTARAEIMQAVSTGNVETPTCPRCDGKMVHSPDDPAMWRCPMHPDQQIPVWK
jgi:hypothetical protein